MKINKYLCLITFLLLFSNSIFGQFEELDVRTLKMVNDEFLIDKDLYSFYPKTIEYGEDFKFWGDTGFGGSNFTELNAGLMVEAKKRAALDAWYDKQRGLIKDEIEEYYYQKFDEHSNFKDNFKEAVDKTFIDFGKKNHHSFFNFDINVFNLKKNLSNTNKSYNIRNTVNLRELNHLNYRKQEILSGNINNSIFTFSEIFGGIKLKDIRDINSINTNWNVIKSFLDTNLPTQQNAKYHSEELGNLDSKFDDFMLSLQRKFYDKDLNPGQRLFLEQFSINVLKALRANPNAFKGQVLNLNLPDNLEKGLSVPVGSEAVLQSYLWGYSKRSVFDPEYYRVVMGEILESKGFGNSIYPWYTIPTSLRYNWLQIAKATATERRNNAFNDLINSSNTEDILTDLAITALGERNNDFLDARPKLREEVEKYFNANNRSQYSHDGINWLLNQYQDNSVFPVDASLFQSKNTPLFQDASNPNRALQIDFKPQAITEGITNFGNVLSELLKDNINPEFEGSLMREIFRINGFIINNNLLNEFLGKHLYFDNFVSGSDIKISYINNLGFHLYQQGIFTKKFLENTNNILPLKLLEAQQPDYLGQSVVTSSGTPSRIHQNAIAIKDNQGRAFAFITPDEKFFFWHKSGTSEGWFLEGTDYSYRKNYWYYIEDKYNRQSEPISWGIHRAADVYGGFIIDLVSHPDQTISDFAKGILKIITLDFNVEKTWESILNADLSDASYVVATIAMAKLSGPKGAKFILAEETPQFAELLALYAPKATRPAKLTWPQILSLFAKARVFEGKISQHLKTLYKATDGYSVFNQVYLKIDGVVSIVDDLIYNKNTGKFILNETKYGVGNVLTRNQRILQDAIKAGKRVEVRSLRDFIDINGNIIQGLSQGNFITISEILRSHNINGAILNNTVQSLWIR